MERLESEHLDEDILLRAEHRHRYMWAAGYVFGELCDLACGYGYGAEILEANGRLNRYVGIDASPDAINQANQRFASDRRRYLTASALDIPLADHTIDSVVSMETLEHIEEPSLALNEFKRILKADGILVGSVPSKYFDEKANEIYGINPYHITRFTHDNLAELLGNYFKTVRIYYSALEIVSHIGALENGCPVDSEDGISISGFGNKNVSGSFHFVATDRTWEDIDSMHKTGMHFCMGLADYDAMRIIPIRKLVEVNEDLVRQKDEIIKQLEETISRRTPKFLRWIVRHIRSLKK